MYEEHPIALTILTRTYVLMWVPLVVLLGEQNATSHHALMHTPIGPAGRIPEDHGGNPAVRATDRTALVGRTVSPSGNVVSIRACTPCERVSPALTPAMAQMIRFINGRVGGPRATSGPDRNAAMIAPSIRHQFRCPSVKGQVIKTKLLAW